MNVSQKIDYNVAILVTDGFEEVELVEPRKALEQAGIQTQLIGPTAQVRAWHHGTWSKSYDVDIALDAASPEDYDALLLPGGVINADALRLHAVAVEFAKQMGADKKPIAAICHGAWLLVNAQLVKGKTMTSWPSLRIDLENAGAHWVDQEVVVDSTLVTSRMPRDIPAFNAAMFEVFGISKNS